MTVSTGVLFGILSMLGWGTADFLVAKASKKMGHLRVLFWTQLIGVALMLIYIFSVGQVLTFTLADLFLLGLIGLLNAFAYLAYYQGLEIGKVSLVSPISASWALITVLLSILFFNETLTRLQLLGASLTILGITMISTNLKELLQELKAKFDPGIKFAFSAMLVWGVTFAMIGPQVNKLGWFLPIMIIRTFTLVWVFIYGQGLRRTFSFASEKSLLLILLLVGTLETIAFFAYGLGEQAELTSIVAPVSATSPLVTVLLARVFLQEKVVFNQMIGIIGIILGIVFLSL